MNVQTKLLTLTVLVTTLVLGAFAAYVISEQNKTSRQELSDLAQTVAERLSNQTALAYWELNKGQVDETLASEMSDKRIAKIVIRDRNKGKIYTGISRNADWALQDDKTAITQGAHYASQTIAYSDTELGSVQVDVSERFLAAQIRVQVIKVVTGVVLLDIVLLISLFIAMRVLIVNPLSKLKANAEQIAAGDFDTPIAVKSHDEIGQVGQAIDLLQISLKILMDRQRTAA